jgi:exodeoxyribonuclease VII small subunit
MSPETQPDQPPTVSNFDANMARLEECVEQLETGQLSLEEALAVFEAGISASRDCAQILDQSRKRVQVLVEKAGGEFQLEFLESAEAEDEEENAGDTMTGTEPEDVV